MTLAVLQPAALRLAWCLDPEGLLAGLDRTPAFGAFALPLYRGMPPEVRQRFLDLLPDLLAAAGPRAAGPFAYAATDCAVRDLLPATLAYAGLLEAGPFAYLRQLPPVSDAPSARQACMAAWDATVMLHRLCPEPAPRRAAEEARDAATDLHFPSPAWTDGAHHAALAALHCARLQPEAAWGAVFKCLNGLAAA